MPHATIGPAHSCPCALGPVTLKNSHTIAAGNCMQDKNYTRWCRRHEYLCLKHSTIYSNRHECGKCAIQRQQVFFSVHERLSETLVVLTFGFAEAEEGASRG